MPNSAPTTSRTITSDRSLTATATSRRSTQKTSKKMPGNITTSSSYANSADEAYTSSPEKFINATSFISIQAINNATTSLRFGNSTNASTFNTTESTITATNIQSLVNSTSSMSKETIQNYTHLNNTVNIENTTNDVSIQRETITENKETAYEAVIKN
jgi:hypothetical protein